MVPPDLVGKVKGCIHIYIDIYICQTDRRDQQSTFDLSKEVLVSFYLLPIIKTPQILERCSCLAKVARLLGEKSWKC